MGTPAFATDARGPPGMARWWFHSQLLISILLILSNKQVTGVAGGSIKPKGPTSRDCSLSIRLEKGSSWEYENCIYLSSGGGFEFHVSSLAGHCFIYESSYLGAIFQRSSRCKQWTYDRPTRTLDGCFSTNWVGWIGWGTGVRMIGASALVALPVGDSKGGKRKAKDGISIGSSTNTSGYLVARYFLAAKDPREVRPNTGELDLFNNSIQVHVQRGMVRVMFAAALPESQAAGLYMIMAKGPGGDPYTGQLQPHDPTLTAHTYIRLLGGGPAPWLQTLHGAVNSLSWGILMPIGALAARHMRDLELGELWYTTHRLVQSVAYSLGAFGFFLGILMWGQSHEGRTRRAGYGGGDEGEYDVSLHRSLGITIFVLASFQVTAIMVHPHKDALLRPWWNILHHWTGRLLLVLAVVNIWEGMSLLHPAMPAWPYLYGLPLGLLVLVASVLEAFSLWRWISEDAPQTQVQRWIQGLLPRGSAWKYAPVDQGPSVAELIDQNELQDMAFRIQRELQSKKM